MGKFASESMLGAGGHGRSSNVHESYCEISAFGYERGFLFYIERPGGCPRIRYRHISSTGITWGGSPGNLS